MTALNRVIAKNKTLALVVLCISECLVYSLLFFAINPKWIVALINLFLIFANHAFVHSCEIQLMNAQVKELRNGDPFPLLFETEKLLTYKLHNVNRQTVLINRAAALRELGQYAAALDILSSINIDKYPGVLLFTKAVYYNNLSDIYEQLGNYEQADIWYHKMMQIYHDMPQNKQKATLDNIVAMATASFHFRHDDCAQALRCLETITTDELCLAVSVALLYAQIYLRLHDVRKASDMLNFIVSNGNRLHAVNIAEQMLRQIASSSPSSLSSD